jgi:hypothetical protein
MAFRAKLRQRWRSWLSIYSTHPVSKIARLPEVTFVIGVLGPNNGQPACDRSRHANHQRPVEDRSSDSICTGLLAIRVALR